MLPKINYAKVGERVRLARHECGFTQAELAEKIDCSNNYISHIEVGQTKVSLTILMEIAYVLDKPLDYFLSDTPYATTDYLVNGELVEMLEKCNKSTLVAVKQMVKVMLDHQRNMEKELLG